ncbi:unnamed protein product [Rangifer tarandus platyrhynchus]|uniref:Uncharacterized protein n=2 Tax=Rangifer tarandus platyrhynchus TaxID=3082113 RepID=A0AC59Z1B7_RANTA|nr:unnamed protein product [Rangifer tarandus platyrhynchus]
MYIHTYICVCVCVCKEREKIFLSRDDMQNIGLATKLMPVFPCAQVCLTLCDPVNCSPPGSSVHGILQARILEWAATPSSRGSSPPGDQTQVCRTADRFFTPGPPRKPDNTGMGSLSLLQQIFPTQELHQCLLHCRPILHQLSYHGSPDFL